jgi:hypothetical protein
MAAPAYFDAVAQSAVRRIEAARPGEGRAASALEGAGSAARFERTMRPSEVFF